MKSVDRERFLAQLVEDTLDLKNFKDKIYRDKYLKVSSGLKKKLKEELEEEPTRQEAYLDATIIGTSFLAISYILLLGYKFYA